MNTDYTDYTGFSKPFKTVTPTWMNPEHRNPLPVQEPQAIDTPSFAGMKYFLPQPFDTELLQTKFPTTSYYDSDSDGEEAFLVKNTINDQERQHIGIFLYGHELYQKLLTVFKEYRFYTKDDDNKINVPKQFLDGLINLGMQKIEFPHGKSIKIDNQPLQNGNIYEISRSKDSDEKIPPIHNFTFQWDVFDTSIKKNIHNDEKKKDTSKHLELSEGLYAIPSFGVFQSLEDYFNTDGYESDTDSDSDSAW